MTQQVRKYYMSEIVEFVAIGLLLIGLTALLLWMAIKYPHVGHPTYYIILGIVASCCCAWRIRYLMRAVSALRGMPDAPQPRAPQLARKVQPAPQGGRSWADKVRREEGLASRTGGVTPDEAKARLGARLDAEEAAARQSLEDERFRQRNRLTRGNIQSRR